MIPSLNEIEMMVWKAARGAGRVSTITVRDEQGEQDERQVSALADRDVNRTPQLMKSPRLPPQPACRSTKDYAKC